VATKKKNGQLKAYNGLNEKMRKILGGGEKRKGAQYLRGRSEKEEGHSNRKKKKKEILTTTRVGKERRSASVGDINKQREEDSVQGGQ